MGKCCYTYLIYGKSRQALQSNRRYDPWENRFQYLCCSGNHLDVPKNHKHMKVMVDKKCWVFFPWFMGNVQCWLYIQLLNFNCRSRRFPCPFLTNVREDWILWVWMDMFLLLFPSVFSQPFCLYPAPVYSFSLHFTIPFLLI